MAQRKFYFLWEEAERLRETYSSWVNKIAYVDKGKLAQLKKITIKPKRSFLKPDPSFQTYHVEFHFESKVIDSSHFLLSNGLTNNHNVNPASKKSNTGKQQPPNPNHHDPFPAGV